MDETCLDSILPRLIRRRAGLLMNHWKTAKHTRRLEEETEWELPQADIEDSDSDNWTISSIYFSPAQLSFVKISPVTDDFHQFSTFTTVADNQQTVQFPVYQGERVNCEDNTSLGEFTLAPIPPMKAGEPVLEVIFEVDVNGILKVTATEKTSGRSANITISNSVGKLSSSEIENMINGMSDRPLRCLRENTILTSMAEAEKFKSNDEAFSKRFEAKQQLEAYLSRVEEIISDPTLSLKLKRGQKEKIEQSLSEAMGQLEIEDSTADDLKKKELALKRLVTKAMSSR